MTVSSFRFKFIEQQTLNARGGFFYFGQLFVTIILSDFDE